MPSWSGECLTGLRGSALMVWDRTLEAIALYVIQTYKNCYKITKLHNCISDASLTYCAIAEKGEGPWGLQPPNPHTLYLPLKRQFISTNEGIRSIPQRTGVIKREGQLHNTQMPLSRPLLYESPDPCCTSPQTFLYESPDLCCTRESPDPCCTRDSQLPDPH